jgi:hypothetical protein
LTAVRLISRTPGYRDTVWKIDGLQVEHRLVMVGVQVTVRAR